MTTVSITLLAACGSGSSSDLEPAANVLTNAPAGVTDPTDPAATTGGIGSELVGTWSACSDAGGLRSDYTFTNTTYSNTVGTGSCAGFDGISTVAAGTYFIAGSALSDTGLDSLELDLMQDSLNDFSLSESLRQTLHHLVYTGMVGQIFFSTFSLSAEGRSLELNLNLPYVKQ